MAVIAYPGPELPALSATFIYEELLGMEWRGGAAVHGEAARKPVSRAGSARGRDVRQRVHQYPVQDHSAPNDILRHCLLLRQKAQRAAILTAVSQYNRARLHREWQMS